MRFQAKFKSKWGEVKTQLVNGETWIDAINHVLDFQNVTEILSVKNLRDVPLSEQISLIEAKLPFTSRKSAWDKQTSSFQYGQITQVSRVVERWNYQVCKGFDV